MRRLGVCALALAALLAGACGSGDDKKTNASNTNADANGALSKIAAGSFADVCGSKAAVAVGSAFASAIAGGDGSVNYKDEADALEKAADAAPQEIREDFQLIAAKLKPFLQAFADANGDYMKLAQSESFKNASTELSSEEYKAAADRVDAWFTEHCK